MSYEIHLVDAVSNTILDTDEIDMTTTFSVADIKDLSARADTITKQVNFKGTKKNNEAFGSMFHLNKVADTSLGNKLFFNYNPLRTVDCLIFEDGMLLLKGNIRVLQVTIKNGVFTYSTVITGTFIELKSAIQDKFLTDLDLTDLKHRYTWNNIKNTWATSVEMYDVDAESFYVMPFNKGDYFYYPYIDYGASFLIDDEGATNQDVTKFNGLNFRPALYTNEYFKRIFAQSFLNGWSYEVKGDAQFQEQFKSLTNPFSAEKLQYTFTGFNLHFQQPLIVIDTQVGREITATKQAKLLYLNQYTSPPANTISSYIKNQSGSSSILYVERSVTADASFFVQMADINNPYNKDMHFHIQLVERPISTSGNQLNGWDVIAESEFTVGANSSLALKVVNVTVGERMWKQNTNIALRVYVEHDLITLTTGVNVVWKVQGTSLDVPKDASTKFTADIRFSDGTDYDVIAPQAPDNVKQLDFLKSIMKLFNLYAFTKNDNHNHLIFMRYDDFYALSNRVNIVSNSLDWTDKIDGSELKIKANLDLPKGYQFVYKEDTDFLNAEYKRKWGTVFGSFQYTDEFGVVDEKKVELIFSPTPIGEWVGTKRKLPLLYATESQSGQSWSGAIQSSLKKPQKTNIRILYYNGVKNCAAYTVLKDNYTTEWVTDEVETLSVYPQTTTYWYDEDDKPVEDLNFGRSKEYFIPIDEDYLNVSQAFHTYYSNQVSEVSNPNIATFECAVNLNEIDISNLDLRVPVFIDLGELGHSYFKVLSVEYYNNSLLSKVVLQNIYLGTKS